MAYRFLRKDYDALLSKIDRLAAALRDAGQEKSLWAEQAAETWHDNFGFEEEEREQQSLSERLEDFARMRDDAEIVDRRLPDEVDIGACVTLRDTSSGETRSFTVGSYMVLDQHHPNAIHRLGFTTVRSFTGRGFARPRRPRRPA